MSQRLTAIPSSFGPRCRHVLLAAFCGFLGVLGGPGLTYRSTVISCPISSRRSDVFLGAFCGLLGMLLPLLSHALALLRYVSCLPFLPVRAPAEPARPSREGSEWLRSGVGFCL